MSIGAIASGIWHSVSSALASPRPETAGIMPSKPQRAPAAPSGEAGKPDPAKQQVLADLQSWINAQQQGGGQAPDPSRVRNAYATAASH